MPDKKKRKILLIDDDVSLLLTLRDFLSFEGYGVTTAESGEKGLEELQTLTPDLIILDMSMPGMGGLGFLKAISDSEGKPRHPVLVLTARSAMAEYFADVEVDGFVAKPCDPQDLLMEVGRIVFLTSADAKASLAEGAPRTVMLAEDRPDASRAIADAFTGRGYLVTCVSRGADVIERAIVEHPDVIVMKLIFGHINGDTVARMLGEMAKTQDIPIVLYDDAGGRSSAETYGISGPTIKRFVHSDAPENLIEAVEAVVK